MITSTDLKFAWPDGAVVFDGLSFVAGPVRTGLVGRNGTGKSTLLRLIAGRLTPQQGDIRYAGTLGYLPQDLPLDVAQTVAEVLGIAVIRQAIAAIEAGDTSEANFAVVGDEWDVAEEAEVMLAKVGLGAIGLDRRIGELSGGETILLGLAAELLRRPDVLLLDEPTNNLDRDTRLKLYDAVDAFRGTLLVVSHDRELLDKVDQIGELRQGELTWYGGNLTAYEQIVAIEQEAAQRLVRTAAADLRKQKRDLAAARVQLDRRVRYGQKMWNTKREPKVVMGNRKQSAQVAAGKHRNLHLDRVKSAQDALTHAEALVYDDDSIRIDLPGTAVPTGRLVVRLERHRLATGQRIDLEVRGPERIALVGANGVGKTTLLRAIDPLVPSGFLPQRLDLLRNNLTIAENLAIRAPEADKNKRRARLARFLFRGRAADQLVGTLSGGERFRATLAALLLAEPPPQLLMLDEPTNNLDLASAAQLTDALAAYQGALIVASHDHAWLATIGITRWLSLSADGLKG
ncbi:ATP-binding cassette domain-containing protein [Kribbella sp. NBC_01245]|uniref:ABC-F family ATP-binding cassette domain-containing protein n=1 Tax=Kribbella sp. NBC_01245 TaxID=2903578 RepID=UPI002E2DADD0|nr:ABC-F family ATP-binding cassette domain-containing protein [Kribbella sp. NBC_01245]